MKLFTKHNHLFTLYFYVDNLFWYFPLYYVSNDSFLYMVANSTSLAYICKYSFVNYVTHSAGGECSIYVIVLDTSHRLYSVLLTAYRWSKLSINSGWRHNQYLCNILLYPHSIIVVSEHTFIDLKVNLLKRRSKKIIYIYNE